MPITGLDHYALYVSDADYAVDFYTRIVGLENGFRPTDLSLPGAWLYVGGTPIVHLIFMPPGHTGHTGAIDHLAFVAEGNPDDMVGRLQANDVQYTMRTLPRTGVTQVFFKGPDQVGLEFNFKPADQPAA